ncbi:hypothetical protein SLA2020_075700 [Shorea laevis]
MHTDKMNVECNGVREEEGSSVQILKFDIMMEESKQHTKEGSKVIVANFQGKAFEDMSEVIKDSCSNLPRALALNCTTSPKESKPSDNFEESSPDDNIEEKLGPSTETNKEINNVLGPYANSAQTFTCERNKESAKESLNKTELYSKLEVKSFWEGFESETGCEEEWMHRKQRKTSKQARRKRR